jgi:hypothetical protein
MTATDLISPDLKTVLRRLKLSLILDTLPERPALAPPPENGSPGLPVAGAGRRSHPPRQPCHFSARATRTPRPRHAAGVMRHTARVTYDQTLWNGLVSRASSSDMPI